MSKVELSSAPEVAAKKAEALPAFSGLNLLHIKRQVAQIIGLIGRDGIFDQYTVHDISHIDSLLESLNWLIPEPTKEIMSPADWLMTVLSIYFHDMGMIVTAGEFDSRNSSEFPRYRDEHLFGGKAGSDYRAKVSLLTPERAERFLYQEFVRHKHAERIRDWINGRVRDDLGKASTVVNEINKLLEPLKAHFRRDLGLICESHHLNDLNDLKKYKPSQPYGNSDEETANLQYCAVLLRTADLLHVTSDRTPSVAFRVINPTDPISQEEWAKQMAVTRVRPKMGLDDEGNPSPSAPKDTVEVHAFFKSEDGFFGLTSYLAYASGELKRSHDWIAVTKKQKLVEHEFPWRKIDDSHIQTEGFIRDTFEFAIDQEKILDLLTGHTLYNDTRVVLRELAQNAIDAIRIQNFPDAPRPNGKVTITWDSANRILGVTDNGTGMSQRIITDFLLKVGTSRYQDPEFKKQFPAFSSISRFGIGVLSAFMVADSVEIVTCHADDEQARQLTLRSVHGKYLIRLLDKSSEEVRHVAPHGTQFLLKVRASVTMPDVLKTAKLWLVLPGCDVFVKIDSDKPIKIGYESPGLALIDLLRDRGVVAELASDTKAPVDGKDRRPVRVISHEFEGVAVAYAVQWSEYFREWSFLSVAGIQRRKNEPLLLGTCIEGIRVETLTPGFSGGTILALANITGPNAPKTNVARSGIEATAERDHMLRHIYKTYAGHVEQEVRELHTSRSFSLTWAIGEARFLLEPLLDQEASNRTMSLPLFSGVIKSLPVIAAESQSGRSAITLDRLAREQEFWTIDCALFHYAEPLIREAGTSTSLVEIFRALNIPGFKFPDALVLCGVRPEDLLGQYAFENREVDRIVIHRDQRRIDLRWVDKAAPPRWSFLETPSRIHAPLERIALRNNIYVGVHGIEVENAPEDIAVKAFGLIFLKPNTDISKYAQRAFERANLGETQESFLAAATITNIIGDCIRIGGNIADGEGVVKRQIRLLEAEGLRLDTVEAGIDTRELGTLINNTNWTVFDPSAWARGIKGSLNYD